MIFERGKLVNYNHIEIKRNTAFFNKPLNILTVDDVYIGGCVQCSKTLFFSTDCYAVFKVFQVIPLLDFITPSLP